MTAPHEIAHRREAFLTALGRCVDAMACEAMGYKAKPHAAVTKVANLAGSWYSVPAYGTPYTFMLKSLRKGWDVRIERHGAYVGACRATLPMDAVETILPGYIAARVAEPA